MPGVLKGYGTPTPFGVRVIRKKPDTEVVRRKFFGVGSETVCSLDRDFDIRHGPYENGKSA